MEINSQARNYARKHGVHVYGLTSESHRTVCFYDIATDVMLTMYGSFDESPIKKVRVNGVDDKCFAALPEEVRTTQGVQMVVDCLVAHGYAGKLDDDGVRDARNKILKRETGVEVM